ncbi:flagellar protein FlaG [Alteromonas mediterranea]|uniref:flagellar protein FlaG n=1 Tax=Alteromonas mediterranea TaxID=314275 RepID=UPI00241CE2CB|nr:flagellar protein FlaG [Alteromonas mediterranea]
MDIPNIQLAQGIASTSTLVQPEKFQNAERDEIAVTNAKPALAERGEVVSSGNKSLAVGFDNLTQVIQRQSDKRNDQSTDEPLKEAISVMESFLLVQNRNLTFSVDENTDRSVVTVLDANSGDVIRQIPSEDVLALAERIQDLQQDIGSSVGVFIDNQV